MFDTLFKKADRSEGDFRKRVVEIVSELFSGTLIDAPAEDKGVMRINGIQIGLQNLRAKFEQSDKSEETLKILIKTHSQLAFQNEPATTSFEASRPKLMPQLMSPEYT